MQLTQAELAQLLDIPLSQYRRLESGKDALEVRYVMRLLVLAQMHGWAEATPRDLCDDETAEIVEQELDEVEADDDGYEDSNFIDALTDLCDECGVSTVMCEVHSWREAPHAHMEPADFLETLENECEMVTTVFIDIDGIDVDASVAEILDAVGMPWPDLDAVPERHQAAFQRIEEKLRFAVLEKYPVESAWLRAEAVYDTGGGGLLRVTSVTTQWYDALRETVLTWLRENRKEFLGLEVEVGSDPEEPVTRH